MREETLYYVDGIASPFRTKEEAERAEKNQAEQRKLWLQNTPESKLNELCHRLKQCQYVHPSTIATCTYDSIRIKSMIKVCQEFVEKNKEFLNHY